MTPGSWTIISAPSVPTCAFICPRKCISSSKMTLLETFLGFRRQCPPVEIVASKVLEICLDYNNTVQDKNKLSVYLWSGLRGLIS